MVLTYIHLQYYFCEEVHVTSRIFFNQRMQGNKSNFGTMVRINGQILKVKINNSRKYLLGGYILGVLMHTTTWD